MERNSLHHIPLPDTLTHPWAMMIEFLDAIPAVIAMANFHLFRAVDMTCFAVYATLIAF